MEQMINIKYVNNLINIEQSGNLIKSIDILKNKLVILVEDEEGETRAILIYDTKTEKYKKKNFGSNEIRLMKIINDQIYLISGTFLKILDENTLEISKSWDIGEKFYYFCLFEPLNNFNIEIIYANESHELKYFSKGYLFEPKFKNLYKENCKIEKIVYQNGLLLWSSNLTMKVFDLEKKKMRMRETYESAFKGAQHLSHELREAKIDFYLFENFLCLNIMQRIIFVYKLYENSPTSSEILNVFTKPLEVIRHDEKNLNIYILGLWLNSAMTKVSLIKSISSKYGNQNINSIKLEIYKLQVQMENSNNLTLTNSKPNSSELIFQRNFQHICSRDIFYFSYSHKNSSVYLYTKTELYFITLFDKINKVLYDLKYNKIDFLLIYETFNKIPSFNEKVYIVFKLIRNLHLLSFDNDHSDNKNKQIIDKSKLIYLINSIITSNIQNNSTKTPCRINEEILNQLTQLLLFTKNFEICFEWLEKYFSTLSHENIKNIIRYLLFKKSYDLLSHFILNLEKLEIDKDFENYLENIYSEIMNCDEKSLTIEDERIKFIYIYALIFRKSKDFKKSIRYLIQIKRIQEIFDLINTYKLELVIFDQTELFNLFNEEQLIDILAVIYNKDNIKFENTHKFYSEIYINYINSNKIYIKIIQRIIQLEKYYLIPNQEIAEVFFKILLENECTEDILRFLSTYDDFDYIKLKNMNINIEKQMEIWVLILKKLHEYDKIIDIYIEFYRDPEKTITFLENLNITDSNKEELYEYLRKKIKSAGYLSPAKKFYFINMFQDMVLYILVINLILGSS
jgi:hypothetical protein